VGAKQRRRRLLGEPGLQLVQRALKIFPATGSHAFAKTSTTCKAMAQLAKLHAGL
jgi:hypothetical protein